jgi:hypothetical protein
MNNSVDPFRDTNNSVDPFKNFNYIDYIEALLVSAKCQGEWRDILKTISKQSFADGSRVLDSKIEVINERNYIIGDILLMEQAQEIILSDKFPLAVRDKVYRQALLPGLENDIPSELIMDFVVEKLIERIANYVWRNIDGFPIFSLSQYFSYNISDSVDQATANTRSNLFKLWFFVDHYYIERLAAEKNVKLPFGMVFAPGLSVSDRTEFYRRIIYFLNERLGENALIKRTIGKLKIANERRNFATGLLYLKPELSLSDFARDWRNELKSGYQIQSNITYVSIRESRIVAYKQFYKSRFSGEELEHECELNYFGITNMLYESPATKLAMLLIRSYVMAISPDLESLELPKSTIEQSNIIGFTHIDVIFSTPIDKYDIQNTYSTLKTYTYDYGVSFVYFLASAFCEGKNIKFDVLSEGAVIGTKISVMADKIVEWVKLQSDVLKQIYERTCSAFNNSLLYFTYNTLKMQVEIKNALNEIQNSTNEAAILNATNELLFQLMVLIKLDIDNIAIIESDDFRHELFGIVRSKNELEQPIVNNIVRSNKPIKDKKLRVYPPRCFIANESLLKTTKESDKIIKPNPKKNFTMLIPKVAFMEYYFDGERSLTENNLVIVMEALRRLDAKDISQRFYLTRFWGYSSNDHGVVLVCDGLLKKIHWLSSDFDPSWDISQNITKKQYNSSTRRISSLASVYCQSAMERKSSTGTPDSREISKPKKLTTEMKKIDSHVKLCENYNSTNPDLIIMLGNILQTTKSIGPRYELTRIPLGFIDNMSLKQYFEKNGKEIFQGTNATDSAKTLIEALGYLFIKFLNGQTENSLENNPTRSYTYTYDIKGVSYSLDHIGRFDDPQLNREAKFFIFKDLYENFIGPTQKNHHFYYREDRIDNETEKVYRFITVNQTSPFEFVINSLRPFARVVKGLQASLNSKRVWNGFF